MATRTQNVLGEKDQGAHIRRTEEIQLSRRKCGAVRREGRHKGAVCHRTGRISTIQTDRRIGRAKSLLRSAAFHHGVWSQGV